MIKTYTQRYKHALRPDERERENGGGGKGVSLVITAKRNPFLVNIRMYYIDKHGTVCIWAIVQFD